MQRTIVGVRPERSVGRKPVSNTGPSGPVTAADITLLNLNMLYMRHRDGAERELHVPLGPLYLVRSLEDAGFTCDFRDYQRNTFDDPFAMDNIMRFLRDPAPVIGLSCMANLLPFTIMLIKEIEQRYPDRTVILGGVGARSVEEKILKRFPWVRLIAYGEGEHTLPELLRTLRDGGDPGGMNGVVFRRGDDVIRTAPRQRITDLDSIPLPAFHHLDLSAYQGYGVMTSRGCPYPCTFCSVAPIWDYQSFSRSNENIIEEMRIIHRETGADLFLFQDEFFLSGRERMLSFCRDLRRSGLDVEWKAFGRVNLVDREIMQAMADAGCIELRFGIESGSDRVLERIKKGFTAAQALQALSEASDIMDRVDAFYMWGFPFETMKDFRSTLFQMTLVRMMGVRLLPSLLCLLPQTPLYEEYRGTAALEFCEHLIPEYVFTGHEVCGAARVDLPEAHRNVFDLIRDNPDIFPGFFHIDLERNVFPKLEALQQFGFYPSDQTTFSEPESCGAHSPRIGTGVELATRAAV